MADILEFETRVTLEPLEFTCGHVAYLTPRFIKQRREDHGNFYCFACGRSNAFLAPKEHKPPPPPPPTIGQKVVNLFRGSSRQIGDQRGDS
jgi:hypothetical protein